ncbi:MAG: MFS transporter [Actinobacteria bacterium]|nr:MFS transporter [Actinomycetota bacterium]
MKIENKLAGNIWKYFVFSLTHRRHFIPILSIYFLTLPDTNAQQIGAYTAIGFLASFLLEIPSGYFADKFGHKKTLILSKALMIFSMLFFIFGGSFFYFALGSIFLSLSLAFSSGADSAFMHDTFVSLKREKEFAKVMSKISANVAFVSMVLIILLPFFTKISILLPIKINLVFDLIGFIIALTLVSPKKEDSVVFKRREPLFETIKKSVNPGFYAASIFTGVIMGFLIGTTSFRPVYLESLGYPVMFIGFVMGLSRFFWFLIGHKIHLLEEKIGMAKIFKLEIIIFPLSFILVSYFSNPYLVGFLFSLSVGYFWARNFLITNFFITRFIKDKNYKATMLSVKKQIALAIQIVVSFGVGFIMDISYKAGYCALGVIMLFILLPLYPKLKYAIENRK